MADKLPNGNWRVRWRNGDRRFNKIFPNKELARTFESQIKLDLVSKEILGEGVLTPTFEEFAELWMEGYCKVEKAKSQWLADGSVLKHHLVPAFRKTRISELRRFDLVELKRKLRTRKVQGKSEKILSPKSINNILVLAKKMLATAVDWEMLKENPFIGVKPVKKHKQSFGYWKPDERDQFLNYCKEFDPVFHDVVLLACFTGLRLGEIAGLKWESVDFERKMLTVKESYNFQLKMQLPHTKNGDIADIPLNSLVLAMLRRLKLSSDDLKFVFDRKVLFTACHKLKFRCRKFEVKEIRFHDLRHTFASCLAMAGVDLMVIKELMRHKSYQMTLRYAHLHPEHLVGKTEILCGSMTQLGHEPEKNNSSGSYTGHETENGKILAFPRSL